MFMLHRVSWSTVSISTDVSYRQTGKSRGLSPANHHAFIGGHFILPGSSKTRQREQLELKLSSI